MEVSHPIYQRIDLLSKLVGVVLVAVGVDRLRLGDSRNALFFAFLGAVLSLSPFLFRSRKK